MNRRTFIRTSSIALTGLVAGAAGCTDSSDTPPPRRSSVIETVAVDTEADQLMVELEPAGDRWVQTRRDVDDSDVTQPQSDTGSQSSVSFSLIGSARAAKGRGTTSRASTSYSSAPTTHKGRAHYGGGAYVGTWYNDHDDEVEQYPVTVDTVGMAYIGDEETFEEQDPGPGPLNWDETTDDPNGEVRFSANRSPGWYRIGTEVVIPGEESVDLGWESIDARIEPDGSEPAVTKEWKLSPRI
ncbi:hypothetical protein ACFQJ7_17080 [Halovenus rubra]|uniref:Uncharacterized protein n=3 Tax=Halovenus rubra TaxID=869890 RepID=A0ACC7DZ95_9EURY|nr:hypothetical protein [Halovenus rubra]